MEDSVEVQAMVCLLHQSVSNRNRNIFLFIQIKLLLNHNPLTPVAVSEVLEDQVKTHIESQKKRLLFT